MILWLSDAGERADRTGAVLMGVLQREWQPVIGIRFFHCSPEDKQVSSVLDKTEDAG